MKLFLLCTFMGVSSMAFSQYAFDAIPDELKRSSNAVVRSETKDVVLKRYNKVHVSFEQAVTVFNRNGLDAIDASLTYDDAEDIKVIEAILYDAAGEKLKRFKEKDFTDVSASGGYLYVDNRNISLDFVPPAYPFTLVFHLEYTSSNTPVLSGFSPIRWTSVGVQKCVYTFNNESGIPIQKIERNLDKYSIQKNENGTTLEYIATNLLPLEVPNLAPDAKTFLPTVNLRPRKFELAGVAGDINSWEAFGLWTYRNLLKGQGKLNKDAISVVENLVKGVTDPKEKAKLIYNYMQQKTRYVNVAIGIGGWKPSKAMDVHELSYGDCKGLTNYTMALLESQGIESYYTIVESGSDGQDIDEDFVALQGNHAILTVPLEDENVFLECTSQQTPFNYLGSFTDDRKVLMITPEGGKFVRTHKYTTEVNKQTSKTIASLSDELSLSGTLKETSEGILYNSIYTIENAASDDVKMMYKNHWGHLNNLELSDINFKNNKDQILFEEQLNFKTDNYVVKAGDRVLFNPNVFNRYNYLPDEEVDRNMPFEIRRGRTYTDAIKIDLPESVEVEAMFEPIRIESEFGLYKASVVNDTNLGLLYTRELILNDGIFPKEAYAKYVLFIRQVVKSDKSKIVLKSI